jgi:circadian clock protein KaiC
MASLTVEDEKVEERMQRSLTMNESAESVRPSGLLKSPTGVQGLDQITEGGLPVGRPTLLCGGAGAGKTLLAMQFLQNGARFYGEQGVFVSFEESAAEMETNFGGLGGGLRDLLAGGKLLIDHVHVERSEIEETGEYDLEGLFVRLGHAIDSIGAKRVALDTIEALFSAFRNEALLRAELRRLFRWLKEKGVTAVVTAERGRHTFTRHGLEEYVADCVILLDHRVQDQVPVRRLRIVKYRGARHGTNEYPFVISEQGFCLIPITSTGLDYEVSTERVSSGIQDLDQMLGGGYFRGSALLLSGPAGSGKTSFAVHFTEAACSRGEKALFVAFEESEEQLNRNMRSIGLDLRTWVKKNRLRFRCMRPTAYGLEHHLALIQEAVEAFGPDLVVIDPASSLFTQNAGPLGREVLTILVDFLKHRGATTVMTDQSPEEGAEVYAKVSAAMDNWIVLRNVERDRAFRRFVYVLKSRGMKQSQEVREFRLTDSGIQILDERSET